MWQKADDEPAECGDSTADFWSSIKERGLKKYVNYPLWAALAVTLLVLVLVFS